METNGYTIYDFSHGVRAMYFPTWIIYTYQTENDMGHLEYKSTFPFLQMQ